MADYIASDLDSDDKNSWGTDPLIFAALNKEFDFSLDAAASDKNHLCEAYLTKDCSGLEQNWSNIIKHEFGNDARLTVWVNPPYGRGLIQQFMEKAVEQKDLGVTTVMLVPATLDAQWLPLNDISEIRIITGGRLSFMHPVTGKKIAGNTKGSMFVVFSPLTSPLTTRYINRDELLAIGQQEVDRKIVLGIAA
jgi:DNA (cytosine-5)-methyltransferase 1